jgi:Type IV secretion-system coupling protein DNA-binding domain
MNTHHTIRLGTSLGYPLLLSADERRRHLYMVGKTGAGKTSLMHNLAVQDLEAGRGFAFLDPHGDEARRLLDHVPRLRTNDVVYFNPSDTARPVTLNVLEAPPSDYQTREFIASGVISAFHHIWRDSWGPRLEHFLRNAVLALMDTPDSTLVGIPMMFLSEPFRERIVARVKNPHVRLFWTHEYARYPESYKREAMGPVLNKIQSFLVYEAVSSIIGHPHSSFDIRHVMDNRRVLIANLSKGQIGEDAANLLGSLLVTKIQLAAMSRADTPEEDRVDFTLYADEFQSFTTSSFATALSEARKYRLMLALAHQYLDQLSPELQSAVLGNTGTMAVFRTSAQDVRSRFADELYPIQFEHITGLANFEAWIKTPEHLSPTRLHTDAPLPPSGPRAHKVIEQSRRHFGRDGVALRKAMAKLVESVAK